MSCASALTSGAAMRQGPHQDAQKSTNTGTRASRTIRSNVSVSTSIGSDKGGRAALHDPQRPLSERCLGGIRFNLPHDVHRRVIVSAMGSILEEYGCDVSVRTRPQCLFVNGRETKTSASSGSPATERRCAESHLLQRFNARRIF